jgi:hypothetical protein
VCVCVTVCLHGVFCPGCSAVATTAVLTVLTHAPSTRSCVPSSPSDSFNKSPIPRVYSFRMLRPPVRDKYSPAFLSGPRR